jgi:metal-responsive CopG/Arc/MetJ family transcriptional regulator
MTRISVRLGEELATEVERVMGDFHYQTKTDFVKDAIRYKLKDLRAERKKEYAWHKLLSAHDRLKEIKQNWSNVKTTSETIHRPRLSLKDLLKHSHQYGQTKLQVH